MTDREPAAEHSPFPHEFGDDEVVLTLTPDQVYVEFAETVTPQDIEAFLAQYQVQLVDDASNSLHEQEPGQTQISATDPFRHYWLRLTRDGALVPLMEELRWDERVRSASPVYHRPDLVPMLTGHAFADELLVRFSPDAPEAEVRALIAAPGRDVVSTFPDPQEGTLFQLRLNPPKTQDVFAVVHEFARSPLVRYAAPNWMQLQSPRCTTRFNDTHFRMQWHLERIGAHQGWDIAQGSSDVVIAIIDSGCDLNHPDLLAKYVPTADRFDVINNTTSPDDLFGHGTACAGIAAAATNNNLGVAGVAPNCMIMPIRLWDGRPNATPLSEPQIIAAIDWARTHRADVVSMSWYYSASHVNADIAFTNAHSAGLVLVGSAGNCIPAPPDRCGSAYGASYPGSHPKVIAVGATDRNDQRKRLTSPDGEQWQSRWGRELSVMAPGVQCWTTDVRGNGGFNSNGGGQQTVYGQPYPSSGSTDGDIYGLMNGTSAAAPQVAGLAALLLSLVCDVSDASVRDGDRDRLLRAQRGVPRSLEAAGANEDERAVSGAGYERRRDRGGEGCADHPLRDRWLTDEAARILSRIAECDRKVSAVAGANMDETRVVQRLQSATRPLFEQK